MLEHNVELRAYNSFQVSAKASVLIRVDNLKALQLALRNKSLPAPLLILGGGNNLLFSRDFSGTVVLNKLRGIRLSSEDSKECVLRVASGENWHDFVKYTVEHNWWGLENLAYIPGTIGAAPIQNIGAFGVEVGQYITEVEVLDLESYEPNSIPAAKCNFAYRDSVFKNLYKGRFMITAVSFKLSKIPRPILSYRKLAALLSPREHPSQLEIFNTVIRIRKETIPDPAIFGNAGSFFKNPELSESNYLKLKELLPELEGYRTDQGTWKISAAYLIEKAGLRGLQQGNAAISKQHALVLINTGSASAAEILSLAQEVQRIIKEKYQINLEPEVNII